MENNTGNMKKVLEGIQGARAILDNALSEEIIEQMNVEQKALYEEAKRASSREELKKMADKLMKINDKMNNHAS